MDARQEGHRSLNLLWMKQVLWAAGIYNIAWGSLIVLLPELPFRWAGLPLPNYPEIWQCLGMVVGVYGVGYIIAAHEPLRHWPIVLVGLLGKVLGPLGMAWSLARGTLPPVAGWTCVTNDLIWWLPFGAILYHAYRAQLNGDAHRATDRCS
jgi:hypothetical protein